MKVKMRTARATDAQALSGLCASQGPGLTNLPADPALMAGQVEESLSLLGGGAQAWRAMLVLEADGEVGGTASVWTRVGVKRPFYSFRLDEQSKASGKQGEPVTVRTLTMTDEFTGSSEVGGLCVDQSLRGIAAGRLAARARYLFIAEHRELFADRVISELRGWQDADGGSPVWNAVGSRFFGMPFRDADRLSVTGDDFIAVLAPDHPIYVDLLPAEAQQALGRPHDDGRRALELLLEEGFRMDRYVDPFDGGPTLWALTDELAGVRDSRRAMVGEIAEHVVAATDSLASAGQGAAFRAARGLLAAEGEDATVSAELAGLLDLSIGDRIRHVRF